MTDSHEFFIIPKFHQFTDYGMLPTLEQSSTCIYFVDVSTSTSQLTCFSKEAVVTASRITDLRGFPVSQAQSDVCTVMSRLPVTDHESESMKSGLLCTMGALLVSHHQLYKSAACKTNHWVFLGFRLFDGQYMIEPVLLESVVVDPKRPLPWPELLRLLKSIVAHKVSRDSNLGKLLWKSGGAILSPDFYH